MTTSTLPTSSFLRTSWFCLVVSIMALATTTASATTVVRAGIPELLQRADKIIEGEVVAARVVPGDSRTRTYTEYTVSVTHTWKGSSSSTTLVRIPGGAGTVMIGAPQLDVGSHVLLLLERGGQQSWLPLGLGQGHFVFREGHFHRTMTHVAFVDRGLCTGGDFLQKVDAITLHSYLRLELGAPR